MVRSRRSVGCWLQTIMSYNYDTFEDWFDELEKFSLRSERFRETMEMYSKEDIINGKAIEWLRAAFECGREKKIGK